MAFTRPVVGADISAADFGQPVYDWIVANTPTAWVVISSYQNGWSSYSSGGRPTTAVRKFGELGLLRIAATGGSLGATMFTLPSEYRPSTYIDTNVRAGGAIGFLNIDTAGNVVIFAAAGGDNSLVVGNIVFSTT